MFTILVTDQWMDGQTNGQSENIMPPATSLACQTHKK